MDFDALFSKISNFILMIVMVLAGALVGWNILGRLVARYGDMLFKF